MNRSQYAEAMRVQSVLRKRVDDAETAYAAASAARKQARDQLYAEQDKLIKQALDRARSRSRPYPVRWILAKGDEA